MSRMVHLPAGLLKTKVLDFAHHLGYVIAKLGFFPSCSNLIGPKEIALGLPHFTRSKAYDGVGLGF